MTTELVKKLARMVQLEGGRALLIGGSVRDKLMGVEPKDFDVEVFGIQPDNLRATLRAIAHVEGLSLDEVGASFQVFKLGNLDVSIPRRERKVGGGHKGFEVTGDPSMTLKEAARRRDFTVNAMFEDPLTGEIIDPFGGQFDLAHRTLRVVDHVTFVEDSLRVLRGIQFAARFNFELADFNTHQILSSIDLSDLPSERIFGEMEKLLLKSKRPSVGLRYILRMENLSKLFGGIFDKLLDTEQDPKWHPEGHVFEHTMQVVDEAAAIVRELQLPRAEALTVVLAALCHDFGKPATTEEVDGILRAHGHEEAGVEPTTAFLDLLGIHTLDGFDVRNQVLAIVENHLFPPQLFEAKRKDAGTNVPRALRRMSQRVRLDLLAAVSKADLLGRNTNTEQRFDIGQRIEWFLSFAKAANVESKAPEPILKGRHLLEMGMKPGPQMGRVLKRVFEAQLDGDIRQLEQAKLFAEEIWDFVEE